MSIEKFKNGTQYVNIVASVTDNELSKVNSINDEYIEKKCIKFIPASGAATRMFKDLYTFIDVNEETEFIKQFFSDLEKFAFYEEIKEFIEAKNLDMNSIEGQIGIIESILKTELAYGHMPKALIKMHTYDDGAATPIDEHIYEGEHYLNRDNIDLHFTIAKEHEEMFNNYVEKTLIGKEHINITYSFQKKETNTMAVDMGNNPFLLENGEVLYRPGGHGALLENLNDLDADIIFIKNVDNVTHRSRAEDTVTSKKKLASIGLDVKKKIDQYIEEILNGQHDLHEVERFLNETLNITFKDKLTEERALDFLDRPLRVCGMVKNDGEPGGGPFVVDNGDYLDLQICEKAEIDMSDEEKVKILNASQFFNPVDLVCFVKDYKGNKFNLMDYSIEDRYFISEKTHQGKKLKALEHPGLWNGAMHNWNTLFVEVPTTTFNPVKTVNDLLRDGHREALSVS